MYLGYSKATQDISNVDRYFDSPPVSFKPNPTEDQTQWVLNWWEGNKWDYPCIAKAARDYLAVAVSEVDVERLFNVGRDTLGIQ